MARFVSLSAVCAVGVAAYEIAQPGFSGDLSYFHLTVFLRADEACNFCLSLRNDSLGLTRSFVRQLVARRSLSHGVSHLFVSNVIQTWWVAHLTEYVVTSAEVSQRTLAGFSKGVVSAYTF